VVNLEALGERTVMLDCDVLQADGGTRTTSISGAFVAMTLAIDRIAAEHRLPVFPITDYLSSISVGIVDDQPLLDLNYDEDSRCKVDMNVVMTGRGQLVELQGTGEEAPFTREELDRMLGLAEEGIRGIIEIQKAALGPICERIGG
jgi:ribonuclease PH